MAENGEQAPIPTSRAPWWRRWWMIVIWGVLGLFLLLLTCGLIGGITSDPEASAPATRVVHTPVPIAAIVVPTQAPTVTTAAECPSAEEELAYNHETAVWIFSYVPIMQRILATSEMVAEDALVVLEDDWQLEVLTIHTGINALAGDIAFSPMPPSLQGIHGEWRLWAYELQAFANLFLETTDPANLVLVAGETPWDDALMAQAFQHLENSETIMARITEHALSSCD